MTVLGSVRETPLASFGQRLRSLYLLGPAFVAGVAYLDPGNVATNLTASSRFGYLLLWVIIAANLSAWVVQYLSAKFGIVTGKSLPQLLGERIASRKVRIAYWGQAQIVAIATDMAEVIGGALALHLLFGLPMLTGGVITGAFSIAHLALRESGRVRAFEVIILTLIAATGIGFSSGLFVAPINTGAMLGGFIPGFSGSESLLLAVGIFGATVMPHAIYAHSALCRDRFNLPEYKDAKRAIVKATKLDVTLAMGLAGAINIAIFLVGAINLYGKNVDDSITGAHTAISATLGAGIGTLFAVGLLASGIASSSVGTYASGVISQGLLKFRIPAIAQRAIALVPALAVIAISNNPTMSLVISQVVLSLGIPFALFPLVFLTSKSEIMGSLANGRSMKWLGYAIAALLTALNITMIALLLL